MPKNRKKTAARQTLRQKAAVKMTDAAAALRDGASAAGAALQAVFGRTGDALRRAIALPCSTLGLTAFLFGLTMLVYYVNGALYLTSSVYLFFPSTVTYHLFDYSMGFVSRAFAGEIISWFTDTVSVKLVLTVSRITVFTVFLLQAGIAAAVCKKAFLKKNYILCAAAVAFAASPITAITFVYNLGLLDQYNLAIALLCFYIGDTKASPVLTPLLCAAGMLVHHEFAYTLLPAVLLIQFYYICAEPRLRRARIAGFTVTVCACVGLAVCFLAFEKDLLTMTEPELDAYLAGKFAENDIFGVYKDYYTFYFFGKDDAGVYAGLFGRIRRLIELTFSNIDPRDEIRLAGVMLPFYAFLGYCWTHALRRAGKGKRLPYLGFLLLPLLRVGTFLISDDLMRFADESYLANFLALAAAVKKDDPLLTDAVQTVQNRLDRPWKHAAAALLAAGYMIAAVLLYTVFLRRA